MINEFLLSFIDSSFGLFRYGICPIQMVVVSWIEKDFSWP